MDWECSLIWVQIHLMYTVCASAQACLNYVIWLCCIPSDVTLLFSCFMKIWLSPSFIPIQSLSSYLISTHLGSEHMVCQVIEHFYRERSVWSACSTFVQLHILSKNWRDHTWREAFMWYLRLLIVVDLYWMTVFYSIAVALLTSWWQSQDACWSILLLLNSALM